MEEFFQASSADRPKNLDDLRSEGIDDQVDLAVFDIALHFQDRGDLDLACDFYDSCSPAVKATNTYQFNHALLNERTSLPD